MAVACPAPGARPPPLGRLPSSPLREIFPSDVDIAPQPPLLTSAPPPSTPSHLALTKTVHPGFPQPDLVAFCRRRGVLPVAYAPLGRPGLLDPGQRTWLEHAAVLAIAARHGRSPAQVVLRWNVQRGVAVVPKSASEQRLRENLRLADFELDAEEMTTVSALHAAGGGGAGRCAGAGERLLRLDCAFDGGGFSLK